MGRDNPRGERGNNLYEFLPDEENVKTKRGVRFWDTALGFYENRYRNSGKEWLFPKEAKRKSDLSKPFQKDFLLYTRAARGFRKQRIRRKLSYGPCVGHIRITAQPETDSDIPASITNCRVTVLGSVGFADSPCESVKSGIAVCNRAGIRVFMITETTGSPPPQSQKIGIPGSDHMMTGETLEPTNRFAHNA